MKTLGALHDAFTFMLELAMLASLGWGGYHLVSSRPLAVLLAVAFPLAIMVFWGFFLAPKARRRLAPPWLHLFRFLCFESAAALLFVCAANIAAAIVGLAALLNMPAAFYFDRSRP